MQCVIEHGCFPADMSVYPGVCILGYINMLWYISFLKVSLSESTNTFAVIVGK